MRRNVAGQFVGIQLISKTDGSAVTTGTTTVYVTGDAGTQAAGSVGSGACTHEGNGFWTYAPAQGETNYTHVAFTFVNTSACNATLQIYPLAYDASGQMTGVTLGAVTHTGAVIPTVSAVTGLTAANLDVAVSTRLASASYTAPLDAAGTRSAVGLASANLDTQLTAIDDYLDTEVAAIKAKTDNLPASPAAVSDIPTAATIASTVVAKTLTESYAADGVAPTLQQAIMLIQQSIAEKSVSGTTMTVKKLDGTTTAATFTLDDSTAPTSITRAT